MTFLRVYCCTYIAKSSSESKNFANGDREGVGYRERERERENETFSKERKIMEGEFRFSVRKTN